MSLDPERSISEMTAAERASSVDRDPSDFALALRALRAQGETRRLARELSAAGIPVLLLKGPDLQVRLYGTPLAYASADLDLLVPRSSAAAARRYLARNGWGFMRANGILWRLEGACAYERDGFTLDLHWGIHMAHLPARTLRPLEAALWERAVLRLSGILEPDTESLLVYLAAHLVGHRTRRPEWSENVQRCAALVQDWDRVWRLARDTRIEGAVKLALRGQLPRPGKPFGDGLRGKVTWVGWWAARGHFVPRGVRDRIRDLRRRRRSRR